MSTMEQMGNVKNSRFAASRSFRARWTAMFDGYMRERLTFPDPVLSKYVHYILII